MKTLHEYIALFSIKQRLISVLLMVSTLIIILAALSYSSRYNRVFMEAEPTFQILTPKDYAVSEYSRVAVEVGLFIRSFSVFDMIKGSFTFTGSIFFKYDPNTIKLEEFNDFTFSKGEILEKSVPQTMLVDGKIYVRYDIKVSIVSALEYQRFPLDSHRIDIGVINRAFSASSLNYLSFVGKNTRFHVNQESVAETPQWKMLRKFVRYGGIGENFDTYSKEAVLYYPVAYFTLEYVKKGMKNALIIVLPIILMLFISLFAMALDPTKYKTTSISLATTALSAIIAYRFIIEKISPEVAYFMLSDYLYFIFLIAIFVLFLLSFAVDKLMVWQKLVCVFFIQMVVVVSSVYFILF
jgi:hypothetical protein